MGSSVISRKLDLKQSQDSDPGTLVKNSDVLIGNLTIR